MRKHFLFIVLFSSSFVAAAAQQQNEARQRFEEFRRKAHEQFENFRDEANRKFAEFKEEAWKRYNKLPAIPKPEEDEIPPVIVPDDEKEKPIDSNPITIDEVVKPPKPEPQPGPISPIHEQPQPTENTVKFTYCGTECKVRFNDKSGLSLGDCSNARLTALWNALSSEDYNNTIRDCLELRIRLRLSDWAYLNMINSFSEKCLGEGALANFLTAYIYCQSGYKMRLGRNGKDIWLLFASKHLIYKDDLFKIGDEYYYPYNCDAESMEIYDMPYPKEQPMSLFIQQTPLFDLKSSSSRVLTSKKYPDVSVNISVNLNVIDFYNTYPTSEINGNFMTRWAMYANTPLDNNVKRDLYPVLKNCIQGLNQRDAANKLINWVQTGFVYEYDENVWGEDRAFFAEESLYYPYCDCEDRAILFSRLVRDLMGLKVVLVFYPGHLATAVHFTESVEGDYITLNGERYVISDPTFLGAGAPVGVTMPDMDNSSAKVILLE